MLRVIVKQAGHIIIRAKIVNSTLSRNNVLIYNIANYNLFQVERV